MELTIHPFLGLPDGDLLEELLDLHTRILASFLISLVRKASNTRVKENDNDEWRTSINVNE